MSNLLFTAFFFMWYHHILLNVSYQNQVRDQRVFQQRYHESIVYLMNKMLFVTFIKRINLRLTRFVLKQKKSEIKFIFSDNKHDLVIRCISSLYYTCLMCSRKLNLNNQTFLMCSRWVSRTIHHNHNRH